MRGPQQHVQKIGAAIGVAILASGLTGCDRPEELPLEEEQETIAQDPVPDAVEEDLSQNSILRADMDARPIADPPLEPLEVIIPFGESGSDMDGRGAGFIDEIVNSEQFRKGGAIILRGHTDSSGHDEVNIRASRRRAQEVADRLIEAGATEDRITIIAMGEQNPIAPNALPTGEPDEQGRARNRRVAVTVMPPPEPDEEVTAADVPAVPVDDSAATKAE